MQKGRRANDPCYISSSIQNIQINHLLKLQNIRRYTSFDRRKKCLRANQQQLAYQEYIRTPQKHKLGEYQPCLYTYEVFYFMVIFQPVLGANNKCYRSRYKCSLSRAHKSFKHNFILLAKILVIYCIATGYRLRVSQF